MAYLIGTDEAGYGPNLGPLVISATAWEVPAGLGADDLYERLAHVVRRDAKSDDNAHKRVAIADSKLLYQPGKGLARLEAGVLSTLAMLDSRPTDWCELWRALVPTDPDGPDSHTCYDDFYCHIPLETDPARLDRLSGELLAECKAAGVRLAAVRGHPVFPATFNRLIAHHGTKGAALSHLTFRLVHELLATLDDAPVSIVCDKHGGRNRYGALLQEQFVESFVEVIRESRQSSLYRWGPPEQRVQIEMRARGENCLPVALASMVSKYLRELAMKAFNQFWAGHIPSLRPTAGYPLDARRFKRDIAAVQQKLGIEDHAVWRQR